MKSDNITKRMTTTMLGFVIFFSSSHLRVSGESKSHYFQHFFCIRLQSMTLSCLILCTNFFFWESFFVFSCWDVNASGVWKARKCFLSRLQQLFSVYSFVIWFFPLSRCRWLSLERGYKKKKWNLVLVGARSEKRMWNTKNSFETWIKNFRLARVSFAYYQMGPFEVL